MISFDANSRQKHYSIVQTNERVNRPLPIYTTLDLCENCNKSIEKIYCLTCHKNFCEECYTSLHLIQFTHRSFFSNKWPGYPQNCTFLKDYHSFFYCCECQLVCICVLLPPYFLYLSTSFPRVCALPVLPLSITKVINVV